MRRLVANPRRWATVALALSVAVATPLVDGLLSDRRAQAAVSYRFPWSGVWLKDDKWHDNWAIDFRPRRPEDGLAVLAAAAGTLTKVCGDDRNDRHQVTLQIEDTSGRGDMPGMLAKYRHLDAQQYRKDLIGKQVVQGQYLGTLYNGRVGGDDKFQFNTYCGEGKNAHLHFEFPERDMRIDGLRANDVAKATRQCDRLACEPSLNGVPFRSSNRRVDDQPPAPQARAKPSGDPDRAALLRHPAGRRLRRRRARVIARFRGGPARRQRRQRSRPSPNFGSGRRGTVAAGRGHRRQRGAGTDGRPPLR